MKILLVHTRYQRTGGEDTVFAAERDALRRHGAEVHLFEGDNKDLESMSAFGKAATTFHNPRACATFRNMAEAVRPDVVHFHNTFPLFSPGLYREAKRLGLPTVKTLHNFRLFCANGLLFRDGRPCEDCLTAHSRWPSVKNRCYRESAAASAVCAGAMAWHDLRGTWTDCIDRYVALTEFGRDKFIAAGLPTDKVVVKPNFIQDPGIPGNEPRAGALFVGRLEDYKGVRVLIEAWKSVGEALPLDIIGDGPLAPFLREEAGRVPGVRWLGPMPRDEVLRRMKAAQCLIMPSLWYEGFPMTIVEAYACGLPVVASDLGAMASIVAHGRTGIKFPAGDANALASLVASTSSESWAAMGGRARADYEHLYSEERNMDTLLGIYRSIQRTQS